MRLFEINDEQIKQFHEDGYLIVPGLFTKEYTDMLITVAKADQAMSQSEGKRDASGGVSHLRLRNDLPHDIYSAFVRSESVIDATEKILGDEVYHFHHKMMLKQPRVGGAWEWHQDFGYWYLAQKVLFPDMLSVAIAVDKATKENGCMQLIKGSHKCGRLHHGTTGDQTGANETEVNALMDFYKLPLVYAELNPGDALFFHSNTLHRSDANRSENPRWTLISCYNTKHNDKYAKGGPHPAYSPLERWPDEKILEVGQAQLDGMAAK